MCAITFIHKLYNKPDPCDNFLFKKLMTGFAKLAPQIHTRIPLTLPMLQSIMDKIPTLGLQGYLQFVFRTMLIVAFAAFLRPYEVTGTLHHVLRQHVDITNGLLSLT